ncbi:MAG TPA: hypothetical protein VJ840_18575 [Gemmatimonadaceae bacterium]|nr:hypothetical protein [Gemmatimonadaceae bacterium]
MSTIDDWAGSRGSGTNVDDWAGTTTPATTAVASSPVAPAPSALESAGTGFMTGVKNTGLGITQLVGKGLRAAGDLLPGGQPNLTGVMTGQQPENIVQRAGDYLANRAGGYAAQNSAELARNAAVNPTSTALGNMAGQTLATAPVASLAPGGLLMRSALGGALAGATQPVDPNADFMQEKLSQAAGGGAAGLAGGAATGALARSLAPRALSPAAADLASRGVPLTPGMNGGNQANKLEQQMTSIPFVGQSVADARNRAVGGFNRAVGNEVLAPVGQTLPDNVAAGSGMVQHVNDALGNIYNRLQQTAKFNYDYGFHSDLGSIRAKLLADGATPDTLTQFDNIVQGNVLRKMSPTTGEMTGPQWGATRSDLNTIARNNTIGQPSAQQTALAHAVNDLGDAVNANVVRNSPPGMADELANVNNAYSQYKTMERAAGYTGARNSGNVFTPAQLSAAVGARSTALQRATNTGRLAELAANAQQVVGTTVPDSGTAGRGWLTTALLAPHLLAHPGLVAGGIGAHAAYSPTGINAMRALMTQRPAAVRALGNAIAPLALPVSAGSGAAAGGALGGLLDYEPQR